MKQPRSRCWPIRTGLPAYGLGMTDLADALAKGNVLQAVGQLQDNHKLYLVMADHSVGKTEAVGDVVVRSDPAGVVRVRDVATVQDGVVPQWIRVVEDGKPAVLFNVYEQPDGNAVQIAEAVHAKLARSSCPPGVRMVNWYDQSELVTQSAGSVRDAVLIGLVLAALVLIAVSAQLAGDVDRRAGRSRDTRRRRPGAEHAGHELQHHDAGRDRRRGRAADRRRHRHGRAHRAARRAPRRRVAVAGNAAVLPASREFLRPLTGSSLATLIVFVPLASSAA